MFLSFYYILFQFISVYNCNEFNQSFNSSQNSKLLIILIDGFRWDYVSRDQSLKGFPLIQESGVHAPYVRPIFPSVSYPNWYTITTGLYAESHGMIDNKMYDQVRNEFFMGNGNNSQRHWWNQTEPLWINAEKQGVKSSMYIWDGCQVEISGLRPSLCHPYRTIYNLTEADIQTRINVNSILNDFSDDKYRLSMLYYELVDHFGHSYGPDAKELKTAVKQIDAILYDLYNQIIDRKLDKTLNVVIVSDHGMISVKGFKKVFLNQSVDFNDIELMLGRAEGAQILPKPNKEDKVYKELSSIEGIKVYKKHEIPAQFHFRNSELVLPIVMRADVDYSIEAGKVEEGKVVPAPNNDNDDKPLTGGDHGWDPNLSDMHGIMYGFGPAFKKNFTSVPLEMVDHYNLFCRLLGITPHSNNGSITKVSPFFKIY